MASESLPLPVLAVKVPSSPLKPGMSPKKAINKPSQSPTCVAEQPHPVFKIVLSGGPCSGKTSALSVLSEYFSSCGWKVFLVTEAATLLFSGSPITFGDMDADAQYNFQVQLMKVMFQLEDSFMEIARRCGQKALVLCDRGAMDAAAYIDQARWDSILQENGWEQVALRDGRYNFVIHLQTAADGAEAFYNTDNNHVRLETPEQARELDLKTKTCWLGHPYLAMIDNSTDFKGKLARVITTICHWVGETAVGLVKRKFLVKRKPESWPAETPYQEFSVQHDYLLTLDGSQARLRKRGQGNSYAYTLTMRFPDSDGKMIQLRRHLSAREYLGMLSQKDPRRTTILKKRRSFHYQNILFELDLFKTPNTGLLLLEAYMPDATTQVLLPPFLDIHDEVTKDPSFSMYNMALDTTIMEETSTASMSDVLLSPAHDHSRRIGSIYTFSPNDNFKSRGLGADK